MFDYLCIRMFPAQFRKGIRLHDPAVSNSYRTVREDRP
jgi:hypothetical protein